MYYVPHYLEIDIKVCMDQSIPCPSQLCPRNLCKLVARRFGNLPCSLADDLEQPCHGEKLLLIGIKRGRVDTLTMRNTRVLASNICRMRMISSARGIEVVSGGHDTAAKIATEKSRRAHIDLATKQRRQLLFHGEICQPRRYSLLELDQDINIAVGTKIIAQDRTEQCQPLDMMPAAKVLDLRLRNGDFGCRERDIIRKRPLAIKNPRLFRDGGLLI